jgi:hypothetical protein
MMETIASTGADVRLSDSATTRAIVWLTAWDSQGFHRTATSGDEAGADWLIREAAGIGAAPEVEKFALDRFDLIDAYLEFDGTRIPGIPVFDAPATGGDGAAQRRGVLTCSSPGYRCSVHRLTDQRGALLLHFGSLSRSWVQAAHGLRDTLAHYRVNHQVERVA